MADRAFHIPWRSGQVEERRVREHVRDAVEQQVHAGHRHFFARIKQQQIVGGLHQTRRLRDHDGVVHVGDHAHFGAAGNGEKIGVDRLAAAHFVRDVVDARFERMLGHEVEVAGIVGCREFAGNIRIAVDRVVYFRRTHLHCFDGHVIDGDPHFGMRGRHHQHATDAANQAAGLPFERAVYGTANQSGVVFGAIADVGFDTWIPVERPHQCGREFQPDTECFGDRAAEQPGQRRFDFKTLMSGGRVEGGDHLACRNRHGGHVIARIVHPLPHTLLFAAGRAAAHAAAGTAATAEFHSYAHYRGRVRTNSNATEKIRELSGPRKALPIKRLRPAGTMRDRKPGRTALSVPRIVPAGRSRN